MEQTMPMMTEEDAAVSKITAIIDAFIEEAEATILQIDVKAKKFERTGKFLQSNKNEKDGVLFVNNFRNNNHHNFMIDSTSSTSASTSTPIQSTISKTLISSIKSPSLSTVSSTAATTISSAEKLLSGGGKKQRISASSTTSSSYTTATTGTNNSATSPGATLDPSESRISLNFTAVVKDPKTGKSHSLNVSAKCLDGTPARVYINGKAFGPCQE